MTHLLPLALLAALSLAGCAGVKPLDYQTAEQREGPGLFSGKDGKFTIYGR